VPFILHSSAIVVVAVVVSVIVIVIDDASTASSCDSLTCFWGRSSSQRVINETAELLIFLVIVASIAPKRISLARLRRCRAALSASGSTSALNRFGRATQLNEGWRQIIILYSESV